jgi:hypothetical protein
MQGQHIGIPLVVGAFDLLTIACVKHCVLVTFMLSSFGHL